MLYVDTKEFDLLENDCIGPQCPKMVETYV